MLRIEEMFEDLGYKERDGYWNKIKQYEKDDSIQMVFQKNREEIIIHIDYGVVSYFKAYVHEDNSPGIILIQPDEHYVINQFIKEFEE